MEYVLEPAEDASPEFVKLNKSSASVDEKTVTSPNIVVGFRKYDDRMSVALRTRYSLYERAVPCIQGIRGF